MRFGGLGSNFGRLGAGSGMASAGIRLSASSFEESSAQNTSIGTLSVSGGVGTYTFTLTDSHSSAAQVAGANGENLQVGSAASAIGTFTISVNADNGAGSTFDSNFTLSVLPAAPVLDLPAGSDSGSSSTDNITHDNTPDIGITFASNIEENDVVRLLDGSTLLTAHTVTALEAASATITLSGLSALSDGSHSLTARLERGSLAGAYSSALAITIDTTAPVLSSPTGTKTGSGTADGTVSTDTGSGTLFWVVDTSATPPSGAQVVAGQDSGGAAADDHGSQAVSGTGTQNVSSSGLAGSTTYYFYYAHRDVAGNVSSVSASSSFTTDAGASYSTEAQQYFTRLNSDPGSAWKTVLAAFIDGLVSDSLWTTFDALQIYAMDTQANALIDLIGNVTPSLNNSPTFTAKQGFSGFSTTAYVKSGFTPSVNGVQFAQNSASMAFYSNTAGQNANYDVGVGGSPGCFILARNGTNTASIRINNGSTTTGSVTDGSGLFSLNRTSSTAGALYRNGSSAFALGANATTGLPTGELLAGFVVSAGSGRQIALMAMGSGRNGTQESNFSSRVATLMSAIAGL